MLLGLEFGEMGYHTGYHGQRHEPLSEIGERLSRARKEGQKKNTIARRD